MNKEFWSDGNLCALIEKAYGTAVTHGFHEESRSVNELLMLVLTEVSEVVDADRRNRHADLQKYKDGLAKYDRGKIMYDSRIEYDVRFADAFESYVKDTVEDELADVCIRLFDLCGAFGISPDLQANVFCDSWIPHWEEMFGDKSLCACMFKLSCVICDAEDSDDDEERLVDDIKSALSFLYCLCIHHGIDLERHIDLKMRYNELRPAKNGKKY